MLICCLGDSLTEGDYGISGKRCIANPQRENYPYYLSKILSAETVNYGKCGYNATSFLNYYKSGSVNLTEADFVIIMLGTNGGMGGENDSKGNADFNELYDLCKQDGKHAKIVLCTPPHPTENPKMSNCGYIGWVKKADDFVTRFAKENNAPLIDLAACPLFTSQTEDILQPNDGLHYGKLGYKILAAYIADCLENLFPELIKL